MRFLIVGAMALALVACSSGAPPAGKGRSSAKPDVVSQVAAVRPRASSKQLAGILTSPSITTQRPFRCTLQITHKRGIL